MFKDKKAQYTVGALGGLAIAMVVAAIVIAMGGEIVGDISNSVNTAVYQCGLNGSSAFNATCGGLDATNTFGGWLDTIALIIVAAVVIGIIVSSFGRQ